jgi:hypothetical protein
MKTRDAGRHSNTHTRPELMHGDYLPNKDSKDNIEKVIAIGAGYDAADYYGDLVAAFSDNFMKTRLDLRGQVREWMAESLLFEGDKADGKISMARAEYRAAQFYKFMHRFTRSEQRQKFLDMANGDPEMAARAMLEYTAQAGQNGQCGHDQGDADGIGGLGKQLGMEEYGGDGGAGGDEMPMGWDAGSGSPELIVKAMRIAELLPRLRRKYSFAAGKKHHREVSPYPADDIEIRPMRSFGEMMRVPLAAMAMDDDEFYIRAAQKQLPVIEHYRLDPIVRHFGLAIDVSGSMGGGLGDGYKRYEYATAVAIALLEQAEEGGNRVSCVLFDDRAKPPIVGTPREVAAEIWKTQFSGGGTAFQPVFDAFDSWPDLELGVMITDGGASFTKIPTAPLQVLVCGGESGAKRLSKVASKYDVVA